MNIDELYRKFLEVDQKIETDSRNDLVGVLFFAWKGTSTDGNMFAGEVLDKGAKFVVIDNPEYFIDERTILVDDSMKSLQDLAKHHRSQFDIPVIALTGSNGKTTTKELISAVLSTEKNLVATIGNLNNHVGVPKTLLRIRPETEMAIIEMGANHLGEIADLCLIAQPNFGIITNIGRAHIGLFGSEKNILRAKTELYSYLEKAKGSVFINGYDSVLLYEAKVEVEKKLTYASSDSSYPVFSKGTQPFVSVSWNDVLIQTKLTGEYNVPNIAAAIAVGEYFNISQENTVHALSSYKPANQRSEIVDLENNNTVIKDYYNANRSSVESSLLNFTKILTEKKKVLVLGDMFELGKYEEEDHLVIINAAQEGFIDRKIFIGEAFYKLRDSSKGEFYKTTDEVLGFIERENIHDSYFLFKASLGMKFSKFFDNK